MNILKDIKNGLLKRREVKVVVDAEKNPGIASSVDMIAEKFKAVKDTIAIKNVKSKFGRSTFLIDAFIYDSVEDMKRIEPKAKIKKDAGAPAS